MQPFLWNILMTQEPLSRRIQPSQSSLMNTRSKRSSLRQKRWKYIISHVRIRHIQASAFTPKIRNSYYIIEAIHNTENQGNLRISHGISMDFHLGFLKTPAQTASSETWWTLFASLSGLLRPQEIFLATDVAGVKVEKVGARNTKTRRQTWKTWIGPQ